MSLPPEWLSDIRIRLASESDLLAMEWDGELLHFRRLYRQIFDSMPTGDSHIWVAIHPQLNLIGQMFLQFSSNRRELADGLTRGYIYGFRIKPRFRGHGLGSKMLEVAEIDFFDRNYSWATLNVAKENLGAQNFYKKRGFQIVADESGRWSYLDHHGNLREVHEPAFRMEKRITNKILTQA